jgi:hypothetical protein
MSGLLTVPPLPAWTALRPLISMLPGEAPGLRLAVLKVPVS